MANKTRRDDVTGVTYELVHLGGDKYAEVMTVGTRVCLGCLPLALSAVDVKSLTDAGAIPAGAVVAEIQADGGVVRIRRDAGAPTAAIGWRIDDGVSITVDSVLADVRLLAQSGTTTNVQIAYFDRV